MEKRILFLVIFLMGAGLWSSAALALAPMGPPMASLQQGQYSAGVDYSYSEMDVEVSGFGLTVTQKDVETNMIFANLGYGVVPNLEVFVRLGAANADFQGFSGDTQFAYGFGTKATFAQAGNLTWGGLFQMSWLNSEDSGTLIIDGHTATGTAEIDAYEIQIAVGPTYEVQGCRIYGGPFLHFIGGDFDLSGTVTGPVVSGSGSFSFDVEQESEFGGFVGAQFDLAQNTSLCVEYQLTGDAWAIGTGIVWRF